MLRFALALAALGLAVLRDPVASLLTLPFEHAICTEGGPRVYTPSLRVECIAYKSRITYAGSRAGLSRFTRIRALPWPQTILPGLLDAHAHILDYGEAKEAVDLRGATSHEEAVSRIVRWVEQHQPAPDEVILGIGWDQELWRPSAFPTAAMLDVPALEGRVIIAKRIDYHAAWVSPALLARLEPLPDHIDGGEIIRDGNGSAQGVFLDGAMEYVVERLPAWSDAQRKRFLDAASAELLSLGIVGVHDARILPQTADFLKDLDRRSKMPPLSIYGMLDCSNKFCGDSVDQYHGDRFTLRTVKLFADGALGSFGAAMIEPYSDKPDSRGLLRTSAESFAPLMSKWHAHGWQVAAHAIGDRANQVIIDAFVSITGQEDMPSSLRWRVEHAQIVRPQERQKMASLGVIASMQPTHATSDMRYAEQRLGDRVSYAYSWQSMLKDNISLCLSSDAPVEPFSPFRGLYAAITRLDPDTHTSPHGHTGWYPEERLTRMQALRGFTLGPAFASFSEYQTGSLEAGKRADFIVIDRDIMAVEPAEQILETRVLSTFVRGKEVFTRRHDY